MPDSTKINLLLSSFLIILLISSTVSSFLFQGSDGVHVPPTNAFPNIKTDNSTVKSKSWNDTVNFKANGGTITGSSASKTVYFNFGNGSGSGSVSEYQVVYPLLNTIGNYSQPSNAFSSSSFGQSCMATGGTITTSGGNTIHTFTSNDTFVVSTGSCNAKILVIAGGGGGSSGGGGAGGYQYNSSYPLTIQSYSVTVGSGGTGGKSDTTSKGSNGGNSIFGSITSIGGGGAGTLNNGGGGSTGNNGGSGGGGGSDTTGSSSGGTGSQGNNGGGNGGFNGATYPSGGGGGSSSAGQNAPSFVKSGNGGNGTANSISGSSVTYAGGGGGGQYNAGTSGNGGSGGGGAGASNGATPQNGVANTGGGGGGGGNGAMGGNGGSGIVIISYPNGGTFSAFHAVDNNLITEWRSMNEIHPVIRTQISNTSNETAAGIAIYFDSTNTNSTQVTIDISGNNSTWTKLRTVDTNLLGNATWNFVRWDLSASLTKYVRIYGTDSDNRVLSILEIKVLKPTSQEITLIHGHKSISNSDGTLPLGT